MVRVEQWGVFMKLLSASLVCASLSFASLATAQDVVPAPSAPSSPPPSVDARTAPGSFACRLGDTRGIPDADAATATFLMCRELSRASENRGSYEVSLRPLGGTVIASVTRLDTNDSRTATLASIAEIVVASSRLADALLLGKLLEDTRGVQTVLTSEAAAPKAVSGQRHIALHVIAMRPIGAGAFGAGAGFGYLYELPHWSFGGHIDIAGRGDGSYASNTDSFTSVAIGSSVRRFLGDGDVAPFVGAGASLLFLNAEHGTGTYTTSEYGGYTYPNRESRGATLLAPFVEGGVSAFRTTRARFVASLRVEAPLGQLEDEGFSQQKAAPKYVLPISLRVGVQF